MAFLNIESLFNAYRSGGFGTKNELTKALENIKRSSKSIDPKDAQFLSRIPSGQLSNLFRDLGIEFTGNSFQNILSDLQEAASAAPPPQILPVTPPPPPPPPVQVPGIFGPIDLTAEQAAATAPSRLLPPMESRALQDVSTAEQQALEEARQRLLQEQAQEQSLIQQEALQEQQALEGARQRFLQEQQAAIPGIVGQFRDIFRPGIEESLQRTRDIFGGRGVGLGGLESSGALQELARRGAQELETQATAQALQGLLGAQQQFGQLGLEAAQTPSVFGRLGLERGLGTQEQFRGLGLEAAQVPSIFRRSGLQRGLELRDILGEREQERELAQLGAASLSAQARAQARGQRGGAIGSLFGAGLGGFLGGLPGASLGSGIGGTIGKLF